MMKPIRILIAAIAALCAAQTALAQDTPSPAGDWHATMMLNGVPVRSVLHIEETAPGEYAGVTGSPDMGQWDTPLEAVTFTDGALTVTYPGGDRTFEGTWDADAQAWVGPSPTSDGEIAYEAGLLGLPVIAGLDGRWEGVLATQGVELRIVFRVDTNEHGTYALMDSPDQLAANIPVAEVARDGDDVSFVVAVAGGRYDGTLSAGGDSLTGAWTQGGAEMPLDLARTQQEAAAQAPNRPQTPEAPFPYAVEEVAFDNPAAPDVRLACTLTTPEGEGPHPAAYLITGSGGQDRDESLLGHKPFLVLADHLTRNGTAVLRCDDRGVAESTGDFATATHADFVSDVEAALGFLRSSADIDPARIGLIGHSEGGVIGPMVAAQDSDVAFLVMMAGLGVAGDELLIAQGAEITRALGGEGAVLDEGRAMRRALFDAVLAAPDDEAAKAAAVSILMEMGAEQGLTEAQAQTEAARIVSPGIMSILRYDPAPVLPEIDAPVLAINGSLDTQVPPGQNLPPIRALLADNPDATAVELAGLNHLFQTAETGAPGEYADIEETFAPAALETISAWLAERGFAGG